VRGAAWSGLGALAFGLGLGLGPGCTGPGAAAKPGALSVEAVSVSATVEAIDHGQRTVLLRRADGTLVAMRLGPEVRNLDQVRKGDLVVATYVDSVAIYVTDEESATGAAAESTVEVAAKGAKPGLVSTSVVELTARVESVDRDARTLTLVGAAGVLGTFKVDPRVPLDRVDPGDDVVARVTEAVAIEVVAP
jgi:hypothetical protein